MADGFVRSGLLRPDWTNNINTGLAGWWALREGCGDKASDISGKGNTGILTNGPTWQDGGLRFDGTDDHVLRTVANFRSGDNVGSITVRFKSASTATALSLVASADAATANDYMFFGINIAGAVGSVYVQTNTAGVNNQVRTTAQTFNDGVTHTAVLTSNGSAWQIIVDGVNQSLTVVGGSNNGTWFSDIANRDNFTIGNLIRSSAIAHFAGAISGVRVFNRTLTVLEAQQLHQNPNIGLWTPDYTRHYVAAAAGGAWNSLPYQELSNPLILPKHVSVAY